MQEHRVSVLWRGKMIDSKDVAEKFIRLTQKINQKKIFLLIDLCELSYPLLTTIQNWNPPLEYTLLFEKTPEVLIKEEGPLLLSLMFDNEKHNELLFKICDITHLDNRLIAFNSDKPFNVVAQHLRNALQIRWGDKEGILRYYAPDLFEAINLSLTDSQKEWFYQYILQWFFLNNLDQWVIIRSQENEKTSSGLTIQGFEFTEDQYNTLMLWAEIYTFLRHSGIVLNADKYGGKQCLLNQLYILSLKADECGIISNEQRINYYIKNLRSVN